eukprot:763038-Hanusia_phi.AAC.1
MKCSKDEPCSLLRRYFVCPTTTTRACERGSNRTCRAPMASKETTPLLGTKAKGSQGEGREEARCPVG